MVTDFALRSLSYILPVLAKLAKHSHHTSSRSIAHQHPSPHLASNPMMRINFQTLTISLCAIRSQCFAPPTTHISSDSVRRWSPSQLSAGASSASDLSGLLNEYKSAASTVSTTASSVPFPPVETAVTPLNDELSESSMRSLTDAVTAATDAADQAARAAATAIAAASKVSYVKAFIFLLKVARRFIHNFI